MSCPKSATNRLFSIFAAGFFGAGMFLRGESCSAYSGGGGYGNITLESDGPKKVYDQALKIFQETKSTVASYNSYTNPQTGKTQITTQIQVDKDAAADLMSRLAGLADVKTQSFSLQNSGQDADQIQKQIDALGGEIAAASQSGRFPALLALGLQQRQSLQSQVQQAQTMKSFARINFTIQERGYDASGGYVRRGEGGGAVSRGALPGGFMGGMATALAVFILGYLLAKKRGA